MEAEKAATYSSSSVRFSFCINTFIFILEVFSCGDQYMINHLYPLSPARPQKLENYRIFIAILIQKNFWKL